MAASFEDTVFGTMPLSSDHPRHKDWVTVCRRAAEEDTEPHARFLTGDPLGHNLGHTKQRERIDWLTARAIHHELGQVSSAHFLELDALSDADKIAFVETIILWVYEYRKGEGRREQFKHALLVEEAHHILSQMKEHSEGAETIMETCLRQIREFGEGVIVIDQEPSKLSNSIKANTYC